MLDSAKSLGTVLLYYFNRRDLAINCAVLAIQLVALAIATALGTLELGAYFWLPFALLFLACQLLACHLLRVQGFSVVWAALLGLMVYEEARWRIFSSSGPALAAFALISAALAAAALCYYVFEECVLDPAAARSERRGSGPGGRSWPDPPAGKGAKVSPAPCKGAPPPPPPERGLALCFERCATTVLHLLCMAVGAALAAAADAWDSRRPGFWMSLAAALLLLIALPPACAVRPAALSGACVGPAPPPAMTSAEMAVALLQSQLERARAALAALHAERAQGGDGGAAAAAEEAALRKREVELLARIDAAHRC